jgi:hypothetical protein
MKILNYYFVLFLSSTALAAEIPIITADELAPFAGHPIRVDMAWKRLDGRYETILDFYRKDDVNPITKQELAGRCKVGHMLLSLMGEPPIPLKMTVVAQSLGLGVDHIRQELIMNEDKLRYYGFIE